MVHMTPIWFATWHLPKRLLPSQRCWARGSGLQVLAGTVKSLGSFEFSHADTLGGPRVTEGCYPELLETVLVFVQVFIGQGQSLGEERVQRSLARAWSRRESLVTSMQCSINYRLFPFSRCMVPPSRQKTRKTAIWESPAIFLIYILF